MSSHSLFITWSFSSTLPEPVMWQGVSRTQAWRVSTAITSSVWNRLHHSQNDTLEYFFLTQIVKERCVGRWLHELLRPPCKNGQARFYLLPFSKLTGQAAMDLRMFRQVKPGMSCRTRTQTLLILISLPLHGYNTVNLNQWKKNLDKQIKSQRRCTILITLL